MKYIKDTTNGLFLYINPANDVETWVADTANATGYNTEEGISAKLEILNEPSPGRFVGHGTLGTPK